MQNGAKAPVGLWHTSNDPAAVCVAEVSPVVVVAAESSVAVVVAVAVGAAGEGLSVVATPLIVVRTGVIVDPLPFASTVTQGFKADSVIASDGLAQESHIPEDHLHPLTIPTKCRACGNKPTACKYSKAQKAGTKRSSRRVHVEARMRTQLIASS